MRSALWTLLLLAVAFGPVQAGKVRVGEEIEVQHETQHPYAHVKRVTAELVWSRTLHHPKAVYIAAHFSRFQLAEGDYVIVRSPDGQQSWRYTGLGRGRLGLDPGGFWASHIKGDTAIVELYSAEDSDAYGFQIDRFSRGLRPKEILDENPDEPPPPGFESICTTEDGENAVCLADDEPEMYDEGRAVARLLIQGSWFCTGWLMGCEGHLMTNNHCIATVSDATNTDYEFMAEGSTCTQSCSFQFGCGGEVEATSATFVQTNAGLDYTLVKLPGNLAAKYGYMTLREEGAMLGERIYLVGHPSGWGKWINNESTFSQDASGYCEVQTLQANDSGCPGGPLDIGYYCDTQGGSSGSPVLGYADHRVVALHHCGGCMNRGTNMSDIIANIQDLPDCSLGQLEGSLELDKTTYSCSDELEITVVDDSLQGAGTQVVSANSTTEGSPPEDVTLSETIPGTFVGTINTTAEEGGSGDGSLTLSHDDSITVTYVDLDDGLGNTVVVQAFAAADCQPPTISRVGVSDVTGNAATVTWDTDEASNSIVNHVGITAESDLVSNHSVRVTGLPECSTLGFSVSSADAGGNLVSDDNGGQLYSMTTGKNTQPEMGSEDTPLAIPDDSPVGALSTISVLDGRTVRDVDVVVDVTHDFMGDLTLTLIAPDFTSITLASGLSGGELQQTTFDDEALGAIGGGSPPYAGRFAPEEALSALDNTSAAGDWRLRVADTEPEDQGSLLDWHLILTFDNQVCGTHASYVSDLTTDDVCTTGSGDGNGRWEAGEQVQFSLIVRNDGSTPMTGVTATVTPLTPGVSMVQSQAAYADLGVGAQALSQPPGYIVQLPGSVQCGQKLEFQVDVQASEGSGTSFFEHVAGQPSIFTSSVLAEDFESGIPAGWTVVDGGSDGRTWFADDAGDPGGCANSDAKPPILGSWAAVDSDCEGPAAMNEELITPQLNLLSPSVVTLEFDHYFNRFESEIADVDVRSTNTGGAWINLLRFDEDSANAQHVSVDITQHVTGVADGQLRFRYHNADYDWFWYVDNVEVTRDRLVSCSMATCSAPDNSPLPVPDGSLGTEPLRVGLDGSNLLVSFDDGCGATSTNLIYGPLATVDSYALSGSECSITNPESWSTSPALAPGDGVWFLVLRDNDEGSESSWGRSRFGDTTGERNGVAASGVCGATLKDVLGSCP